MGRNDAIQIIKNAIEELSDRHQTAWNEMEIKDAGKYWESAQTLRRFLNELTSTQGQSIRLT